MAASNDDYYALLGIGPSSDTATLRRAWRQLALKWHPDRAGSAATATFQAISAAYAVLSDPVARAAYDRKRGFVSRREPATRAASSGPTGADIDAAGTRGPATEASGTPDNKSASEAGASARTPSTEPRRRAPGVMLDRLSGTLNTLVACGIARRAKGGTIDLFLHEEEVEQGGMVSISMYVPVRCQACIGSARPGCSRCDGRGTTEELFSAWLAVPPEVASGTLLIPSALLPGMVNPVTFRVRRRAAAA